MIVREKRPEMSLIRLMILADQPSCADKSVHMGHMALDVDTLRSTAGPDR
jgi:hypothetical protein